MTLLKVKIKKLHSNSVIPKYSYVGDAGMDVTCTEVFIHKDYIEYKTGLSIEIPENFVGLLFPRSSVSKKDLLLCNSVGVLDSNFRGEICFRFKHTESDVIIKTFKNIYEIGDRVGQIIILPIPSIEFEEVEELNETERNTGGFGSTGL